MLTLLLIAAAFPSAADGISFSLMRQLSLVLTDLFLLVIVGGIASYLDKNGKADQASALLRAEEELGFTPWLNLHRTSSSQSKQPSAAFADERIIWIGHGGDAIVQQIFTSDLLQSQGAVRLRSLITLLSVSSDARLLRFLAKVLQWMLPLVIFLRSSSCLP